MRKTKSRMTPTSVAVLKTFRLSVLVIFSVRPMNMGMLPNGSTIRNRTSVALAVFRAKSTMTSDMPFSQRHSLVRR